MRRALVTGGAPLGGDAPMVLVFCYVEHRSLLVDLTILLRTPLALVGGTYKGATGGWR